MLSRVLVIAENFLDTNDRITGMAYIRMIETRHDTLSMVPWS